MADSKNISGRLYLGRRRLAEPTVAVEARGRFPRWTLLVWGIGTWALILVPLWAVLRSL